MLSSRGQREAGRCAENKSLFAFLREGHEEVLAGVRSQSPERGIVPVREQQSAQAPAGALVWSTTYPVCNESVMALAS